MATLFATVTAVLSFEIHFTLSQGETKHLVRNVDF